MEKRISPELLKILACPVCKGELNFDEKNSEVLCLNDKLAYKIVDGTPIMLIDKARKI